MGAPPGAATAAIRVSESAETRSLSQFGFADQTGSIVGALSASQFEPYYQRTWGGRIAGATHGAPCGQAVDVETGLHYNLLRLYDPETQRYLSPDPLDIRVGQNEFSYVRSPVRWSDPLGAAEECPSDQEDSEDKQRKFTGITDPGLDNFVQRLQEA